MSELNMSDSDAKPCPSTTNGVSVGDKLRCNDSRGSCGVLHSGEWYTVCKIHSSETGNVFITGSDVAWALYRFDLIIRFLRAPAVVPQPNPYADWKSGDSVRCLEAADSGEFLADKHVYEIDNGPFLKSDKWRIRLVGLPRHEWNCERFERVAPIVDVHSEPDKPVVRVGSRVRCDDASGLGTPWIVLGEIYTVSAIGDLTDGDTFIGVDSTAALSWKLSRFTLLPDEVAPVVPASQADLADADLMHADEARRKCDERFMEHCRELRHVAKTAIESAIDGGDASACIEVPHGDYYPLQRWLSRLGYGLSVDAKKIGCVLARISW